MVPPARRGTGRPGLALIAPRRLTISRSAIGCKAFSARDAEDLRDRSGVFQIVMIWQPRGGGSRRPRL